jgi:hypothetical protein
MELEEGNVLSLPSLLIPSLWSLSSFSTLFPSLSHFQLSIVFSFWIVCLSSIPFQFECLVCGVAERQPNPSIPNLFVL